MSAKSNFEMHMREYDRQRRFYESYSRQNLMVDAQRAYSYMQELEARMEEDKVAMLAEMMHK